MEFSKQWRDSIMRLMGKILLWIMLTTGFQAGLNAQQLTDNQFAPTIGKPEYQSGVGPLVSIDGAHLNFHTAEGGYAPFARLLTGDGYRVSSNTEPFTKDMLSSTDILVVVNAMHEQSFHDWAPLPNHSAFTDTEIANVDAWVREGGALLLIADHMPLAGHSEKMAAAFGIRFQNGFAFSSGSPRTGQVTFISENGTLADSVISRGRHEAERVNSVTAFTGQAFRIDPQVNAQALLLLPEGFELLLPEVAYQFSESTPRIPAANLLQGAIVYHGRGLVAVFAEAAMFSAQLVGPEQRPMGMNAPEAAENKQFVLNLMHWLSGRMKK